MHLNIRISGKVQGVLFRQSLKNKAQELDLKGFARNEPEGTVYVEVEGRQDDLKDFLHWCHEGPEQARVSHVQADESAPVGYANFMIID